MFNTGGPELHLKSDLRFIRLIMEYGHVIYDSDSYTIAESNNIENTQFEGAQLVTVR